MINVLLQITSFGCRLALITTSNTIKCIGFSEIASAKVLFFALSAKFLTDYFGHGSYFCSDSQYLRPLRRMPLRFLFPYIVLIFCLFFLHQVYATVTDGNEVAAVQVADGLLVHLLAHLEARLDLLGIAFVS